MVTLRTALLTLLFAAFVSASAFGYSAYYLPQAAAGVGGDLRFMTQISLFNDSSNASDVLIALKTNEGGPWTVNTSCSENDSLNGSNSALTFVLPGNNKYAISMTLPGDFQVGWVTIFSDLPLSVTATYGFYERVGGLIGKIPSQPLWEAAVLPASSAMELQFAAHSRQGDMIYGADVNTGFAVSNTNSVPVQVLVTISTESGSLLGSTSFALPTWGHRAQFINELFNTLDLSDIRAVVRFSATGPIAVAAMREAKRLDQVVYSTVAVEPSSNQASGLDYDREPNNEISEAQGISAPAQIYGTICHEDNQANIKYDYYRIGLEAGQRIEIVILAGSLGSGLDPSLTLRNSSNDLLEAATEISAGTRDRKLTYTAPAAGQYFLRVGDFYGTDTRGAFYRMFVRVF